MSDLAHFAIDAETAFKANINGATKEERETARISTELFEARIREAPLVGDLSYSSCAEAIARVMLEAYETYPQLRTLSDTHVYLEPIDWANPVYLNVTFTDILYKLHPQGTDIRDDVLDTASGFMWGWAVNAARSILGLGSLPNPALLKIGIPEVVSDE